MIDAYSPLKALRHLDVIQAVRESRPARPVHVQLIISDLCQHACSWCSYRDPNYTSSQLFYVIDDSKKGLRKDPNDPRKNFNPNRMIPFDKVLEILDDCKEMGVEAIQLTGGGEPTVHPKFVEICNAIRERGMAYSVVSNGCLVPRKAGMAEAFARASWVRISIDASHAASHAKQRSISESEFGHACAAVRLVRETADRLSTGCVIGVGFVVNRENWSEVYDAMVLAKELGAHNGRVSAQYSSEDEKLFDGFRDQCAELSKRAEELTDDSFVVFNRFSARVGDLTLRQPDYDICGYSYFVVYIGGDQSVYRCCATSYNEHGYLGSIKEQRFKDMWMSAERVAKQDTFCARSCDRCMFNSQNRVLDYVLRPESPMHAEFV
jgi:MoaA/NifB/PqqE/SkfB family radical SAM enzyme